MTKKGDEKAFGVVLLTPCSQLSHAPAFWMGGGQGLKVGWSDLGHETAPSRCCQPAVRAPSDPSSSLSSVAIS